MARARDSCCMELQDCTRCMELQDCTRCSGAAGAEPDGSGRHETGTEGVEPAEVREDMLAAEPTRRMPPRIDPDEDDDDEDDDDEVIGMPMGCVCAPAGEVRTGGTTPAGLAALAPG